jgi:hypothetical protein
METQNRNRNTSKEPNPLKVEMRFLLEEHHKRQSLELHRKIDQDQFCAANGSQIVNLKTLMLLDVSFLMGCDIEWEADLSPSMDPMAALFAGGPHADADDPDTGNNGQGPAPANGAAAADPRVGPLAAANANAPAPAAAAGAAPAAGAVPAAAPAPAADPAPVPLRRQRLHYLGPRDMVPVGFQQNHFAQESQ